MLNVNWTRVNIGSGDIVLPNNSANVSGKRSVHPWISPSLGVSIRHSQATCRSVQVVIKSYGYSLTVTLLTISASSLLKSASMKVVGLKSRDSPPLAYLGRAVLDLAKSRVRLKWIRTEDFVLSQNTAEQFFRDRRAIREPERDFVVELPIICLVGMESQQNAALRHFCFRWSSLDLQRDRVGRMLVPNAFIAFGFGDFLPVVIPNVHIQFAVAVLIVGGRIKLRFHGGEGWPLGERGGREHYQSDERQAGHDC